jgi:hypothetical protein
VAKPFDSASCSTLSLVESSRTKCPKRRVALGIGFAALALAGPAPHAVAWPRLKVTWLRRLSRLVGSVPATVPLRRDRDGRAELQRAAQWNRDGQGGGLMGGGCAGAGKPDRPQRREGDAMTASRAGPRTEAKGPQPDCSGRGLVCTAVRADTRDCADNGAPKTARRMVLRYVSII